VEIATAAGQGTPPHHHEDAESFLVLEGEQTFYLGNTPHRKKVGEFIHIPAGTIHAFRNETPTTTRMLGINMPGGPHLGFFAEAGDPVSDATTFPPAAAPDMPRILRAAERARVTLLPPK
jgi:gentisate 1,2-dioxygenase